MLRLGGMGWQALAINFGGAPDGEVYGMCLPAKGWMWWLGWTLVWLFNHISNGAYLFGVRLL